MTWTLLLPCSRQTRTRKLRRNHTGPRLSLAAQQSSARRCAAAQALALTGGGEQAHEQLHWPTPAHALIGRPAEKRGDARPHIARRRRRDLLVLACTCPDQPQGGPSVVQTQKNISSPPGNYSVLLTINLKFLRNIDCAHTSRPHSGPADFPPSMPAQDHVHAPQKKSTRAPRCASSTLAQAGAQQARRESSGPASFPPCPP